MTEKTIILEREATTFSLEWKLKVLTLTLQHFGLCREAQEGLEARDDVGQAFFGLGLLAEEAWEEAASLENGAPIREGRVEDKPSLPPEVVKQFLKRRLKKKRTA